MSDQPWYQEGLAFTCSQCGDCCTGATGYVWVDEDDLVAIAEHLDKPIGEIRLFHTLQAKGKTSLTEFPNGDCTFFDPQTRGCKIYPVRPSQCRTWPFWQSNISSPRSWQQTCRDCPGAGTGNLVTVDQIEHLASQSDV